MLGKVLILRSDSVSVDFRNHSAKWFLCAVLLWLAVSPRSAAFANDGVDFSYGKAIYENVLTSVYSQDSEVETEARRVYEEIYYRDFGRTIWQSGFKCMKPQRREDFDIFCDHEEPYRVKTDVGFVGITVRRAIFLSDGNGRIDVLVKTGIIAP